MAFLVLVIDTGDGVLDLNGKMGSDSTKPHDAVIAARNYLDAILAGTKDANIQMTTRTTDPAVTTAGSGSAQTNYILK